MTEVYDPVLLNDLVKTMPARKTILAGKLFPALPIPSPTWITRSPADVSTSCTTCFRAKKLTLHQSRLYKGFPWYLDRLRLVTLVIWI